MENYKGCDFIANTPTSFFLQPENIKKDISTYAITKYHIGKGGSSEVFLGICRKTNEKVAVKIVNKCKLSPKGKENILREIEIHKYISSFSNPNICNLLDHYEDEQNYYLFLEYLEKDLVVYIEKKKRLEESDVIPIFRKIMEVINFLHSYSIAHRDIKAENFLITMSKDSDTIEKIKLCDFGLAQWTHSRKKFSTFCGSPNYTAPEVFENKMYSGEPTDIWAAGVLLYVLLFSEFPFSGDSLINLAANIKNGDLHLAYPISDEAKELLCKMLDKNVETRIVAKDVLEYEWLAEKPLPKIDW